MNMHSYGNIAGGFNTLYMGQKDVLYSLLIVLPQTIHWCDIISIKQEVQSQANSMVSLVN